MKLRTAIKTLGLLVAAAALVWGILRVLESGGVRVEEVVLADFDFTAVRDDSLLGPAWDPDPGLHWFCRGWAELPDSGGVWMLGDEAAVRLRLLGTRATLQLECTTAPALAESGQAVTILLGDRELGVLELPWGWTLGAWSGVIPDDVLRQGVNEIVLRPARHLEAGALAEEPRPIAVFVKRLRVTAWLDPEERARWEELTAPVESPPGWRPASAGEAPRPDPAALPDVLFVVTDAAHAAHLGCYGYERPTTPHLDALAAEGVRFSNVFANAPFTLISVPSLLTGLPWRDHRVLRKGDVLPDAAVTLAEIMRGLGYFTLCLSDNLFVSRGGGLAQGFDQFDELWKHPRRGAREDNPEIVERVFGIRTRRGFDGRPLFAYLHMMPPHTPYAPGPEHDLWRDPGYGGDIDGTAEDIEARTGADGVIAGADLERLVSLYDGNLHRIDASVGRMLAEYRALDRGRELLIVYTSDHGEAFGQHGRFQHLTTVYDEMTRVPLVLWPAAAWSRLEGCRESLWSLSDVVPLLLQKLGAAPPAGTPVTERFLALLDDPAVPRDEVAIRTTVHAHTLGLRTRDWLAVFDGFGRQELFDLAADPAATRNLRGERPELYRELLGRLQAILAAGGAGAGAEASPARRVFSAEDERRLRALGY